MPKVHIQKVNKMDCDNNHVLWVEKYRPHKLFDIILPNRIKNQFNSILEKKQIPNLMFVGGAGVGKTTLAQALCEEIGVDWIKINASSENGIDMVRTTLREFASTISLSGNGKVVIVDEADNLTPDAQKALRASIEEYAINCTFIFTCNYPNRIIPAIHSRLPKIDFSITNEEKVSMQFALFERVKKILSNESVTFDPKVLVTLIQKFYPDIRILLGYLQEFSRNGEIDSSILSNLRELEIVTLIKHIKDKSFKDIRQWCSDNSDNDLTSLYGKLYKSMIGMLVSDSIPEMIMIIEDYQRYDSIVPDKELHLAALCVQLMMQVKFK